MQVLHLRKQLHILKRCKDKTVDDDVMLSASSWYTWFYIFLMKSPKALKICTLLPISVLHAEDKRCAFDLHQPTINKLIGLLLMHFFVHQDCHLDEKSSFWVYDCITCFVDFFYFFFPICLTWWCTKQMICLISSEWVTWNLELEYIGILPKNPLSSVIMIIFIFLFLLLKLGYAWICSKCVILRKVFKS